MALGFKKKGLFGASAPDMTTTTQPMAGMGQGIQEQPKSGGFFGEGGAGRAIAGTVGDYLLQQSGMSPLYAPAMAQQQQAAIQSAAEQRKRSLDMADWKAKHDYEIDNPKEQGPTAMQRNLEYWQTLTPEQKRAYQEMNPEYRQGADGRFYRIDVAPQGPQPGAIEDGYRFKGGNPSDPNAWEPVGGGVGNGTGNFR